MVAAPGAIPKLLTRFDSVVKTAIRSVLETNGPDGEVPGSCGNSLRYLLPNDMYAAAVNGLLFGGTAFPPFILQISSIKLFCAYPVMLTHPIKRKISFFI